MNRHFFRAGRSSLFCARRAAMATAAAVALTCGGAALAQPMGGAGGPMGHGPKGPGGPGFFGEHFATLLEDAKASLALNTSQQVLWDSAVAQSKSARESGRVLHQKVRDAMQAELAKAEPDLAALAAIADDAQAQGQVLRRQVRDGWLKLYATFNAQQKGVVRDLLQQRMAKAEQFHQRMRDRFGNG